MIRKNSIKYKLAPQTKFYDSMGAQWKPFVMFNHFPNIRSSYCNTDKDGLRYNNYNNKINVSNSIFEQELDINKKKAVLVGGSFAFGEGATSDSKTIASLLSKESRYNFINLAGRGFSGYQEIINFMSHLRKIRNIEKVVILSGLNDIVLNKYIEKYDETFGPIFGYDVFTSKMKEGTGWKKKVFKFLFGKFFDPNINWNEINSLNWRKELFKTKIEVNNFLDNDKKLENTFDRNLMIWSIISKGMNLNIDFVLQPTSIWQEKNLSKEEEKIFKESDALAEIKKVYKSVTLEKYIYLKKMLNNITKKYNINFVDCNEILKKKDIKNWIYVDKVHMNDAGNELISQELVSNLSLNVKSTRK